MTDISYDRKRTGHLKAIALNVEYDYFCFVFSDADKGLNLAE